MDPLGQYAVTQSSDRTVRLYECIIPLAGKTKQQRYVPMGTIAKEKKQKAAAQQQSETLATVEANSSSPDVEEIRGDGTAAVSTSDKPRTRAPPEKSLFMDETFPSFFRRCAFSTDGEFLLTPAAQYERSEKENTKLDNRELAELIHSDMTEQEKENVRSKPTVYVFHRSNLTVPVAHLPVPEPAVTVKFCPRLFKRVKPVPEENNSNSNQPSLTSANYRMIFAVATTKS